LFNMASDSGLFRVADELGALGADFDGWAWQRGTERWLPLYEGKLLSHWDHRASTYAGATEAELRMQTLPRLSEEEHDDSHVEVLARYWLTDAEVERALETKWDRDWLLGWRDITGQEKWRTFVPCVLPRAAVGHVFPIAFPANPAHAPLLQAVWSSLVFDYISRQKLSGTHMSYAVVKQLACPEPADFDAAPSWSDAPLDDFVRQRVLELAYTSWMLAPYAVDVLQGVPGVTDPGPPFRWLPERRAQLGSELDAAMLHLYGLDRNDAEQVLDSFPVVRKYDERDYGYFVTKRLVLSEYDAMTTAALSEEAYRSPLNPPPGEGPRHEDANV
jgi:hypothetical protein